MSKDDEKADHPKATPPPKHPKPSIEVDVKANLTEAKLLVEELKDLDEQVARSQAIMRQVMNDMTRQFETYTKLKDKDEARIALSHERVVEAEKKLRDQDLVFQGKLVDHRLEVAAKCQDWIDDHFPERADIEDINAIEATKWKKVVYNVSVRNYVDAAMSLATWALGEMSHTWQHSGPAPSTTESYREGKRIR